MMFRLRSNDVAPKARNDVPFVRDKRYFHSVGEGSYIRLRRVICAPRVICPSDVICAARVLFICDRLLPVGDGAFDVPPIIAKITVCSLSVGDGAFSSEILTALRAVSPALRLGFDCVPPDTVRCHSELVELLGQRPKSTR